MQTYCLSVKLKQICDEIDWGVVVLLAIFKVKAKRLYPIELRMLLRSRAVMKLQHCMHTQYHARKGYCSMSRLYLRPDDPPFRVCQLAFRSRDHTAHRS